MNRCNCYDCQTGFRLCQRAQCSDPDELPPLTNLERLAVFVSLLFCLAAIGAMFVLSLSGARWLWANT
jgi:hypothetical protein